MEEIFDFDKGKPIYSGYIDDNRVFTKKVKNKHLFRKYNGFSINSDTFNSFEGKVDTIIIFITDTKVKWFASYYDWKTIGEQHYCQGRLQRIMKLDNMKRIGSATPTPPLTSEYGLDLELWGKNE
jgi:hypothetical protein